MAQLVDTSVFIALERQRLGLDGLLRVLPSDPIALAAITVSELLMGVHYADTAERRGRRQAFIDQVLGVIPVIPFDLLSAQVYARLTVDLRKSGWPVRSCSSIFAIGLKTPSFRRKR